MSILSEKKEKLIAEAIQVAKEHGYRVFREQKVEEENPISESAETAEEKAARIEEAKKVAEAHGYKVIKEDAEEDAAAVEAAAEEAGEEAATEEAPVADEGELITIQVTPAELEAIKAVIEKIEYAESSSGDDEAAAGIVDALNSDEVYGSTEG